MKKQLNIFICFFTILLWGIVYEVHASELTKQKDILVSSSSADRSTSSKKQNTTSSPKKSSSPKKFVLDKKLLKYETFPDRFQDPLQLIELVPIVREINRWIPRRFSLAEHDITLDPNQVVIHHQFHDARSRSAQKSSILSLSYAGRLGRGFNTRLDMPLFYSSFLGLGGWERYPLGNYTMTILRGLTEEEVIYLRALTRF